MTPRNSYALLSKQGSFHVSHVILSFVFCSIKLAWKNVYFSFIYSSIHFFFFQHRTEDEQHFVCDEKIRIPRQEFYFQITKTVLTYEKYSMKMSTDDNCRSLKHPVVSWNSREAQANQNKNFTPPTRASAVLFSFCSYCFFGFACSLFTHSFSCLTGESFSPFLIVYTILGLFTIANSGPVYMEFTWDSR